MGGKRSHRAVRCIGCRMHVSRCLCASIPVLSSRVRFLFLLHPTERWKTTSSGRIAARAFSDAEVVEWVGRDRPFRPPAEMGDAAVLFPTDEALAPLSWVESVEARGGRPTIVVPDGTWPQCRKMIRKHHALNDLPRITLPAGAHPRGGLRHTDVPAGMVTLDAIAWMVGAVDGPASGDALLGVHRRMVQQTLASRGVVSGAEG